MKFKLFYCASKLPPLEYTSYIAIAVSYKALQTSTGTALKLVVTLFTLKLICTHFLSLRAVFTAGNIEQSADTRSGE